MYQSLNSENSQVFIDILQVVGIIYFYFLNLPTGLFNSLIKVIILNDVILIIGTKIYRYMIE